MIRTKLAIDSVPSNWIFEHYCRLQEKLYGQDIKITSLFNPGERTPSMCVYYDGTEYRFKDYSSGKSGNATWLVVQLHNITEAAAELKIRTDYDNEEVITDNAPMKKVGKFKVTSHMKRQWNTLDVKFWTDFNIGSKMLNKYNVFPLAQYTMSKATDDGIEEIVITGQYIYGYFNGGGELYKVYQPYREKKKFINVMRYVQGSDQLTYSKPLLLICSSLKDMMTLDTLDFNVESVAPASENTMLAKSVLSAYSLKYKGIMTLFDNDSAGRNSMQKYKDKYGIPGIFLKMSKDLSHSVRDFGVEKTKQYLTPLIPTV
jgi:hypothetical protein